MSGRKPFQDLAEKVTGTPEGRARVDEYRRLMDAIVSLYRLREQRGLTQVDVARALTSPKATCRASRTPQTSTSQRWPGMSRHWGDTWS